MTNTQCWQSVVAQRVTLLSVTRTKYPSEEGIPYVTWQYLQEIITLALAAW